MTGDTKPEEFAAYNAFAESCKADAKILLVRDQSSTVRQRPSPKPCARSETFITG